MKTSLQVGLFFVFIFCIGSFDVFACTCKYPPNLTEREKIEGAFKNTDFVFTGKVIKVFQKRIREGKDIFLEGEKTVVLEIIGDFKNNIRKKNLTIKTGMANGDCGVIFQIGEKYIVYAVFTKTYNSKNQYIKTEIHTKDCSRTTLLSKENSDIEIINQIVETK